MCALSIGVAPAQADTKTEQWQLAALDARDAWKVSTGKGVTVAVIDSGVDAKHPDLAGQLLPGLDLVDPGSADAGRTDPVGHGTTVASLIAGKAEGMAPDAKILPIRVLDKENKYDDPAVVAQAVRWAVDNGATVVNLSLGGALRSDAIAGSLRYAAAHDVVVVACTGNIATDPSIHEVWYPAREPGVVAVAGLLARGKGTGDALWNGSLTGPETVLSAPAVDLTGARPGGGYWQVQGTSFAAPLVSAAASLVRARYPQLSAANVVNRLIGTARDLGPAGRDDRFGFGEIDPVAALRNGVDEVAVNPLTLGGDVSVAASATEPASARPGGAAPMPSGPETERLAGVERSRHSAFMGLVVMLLIFTGGAAGLLIVRRRRSSDGV